MYRTINLTDKDISIGEVNISSGEEVIITDTIFKRYREEFKDLITLGKLNIRGKSNTDSNFLFKNSNKTIGIFMNNYNYYSGGRYYVFFLAHALIELNYNVVIISDQFPSFMKDFNLYNKSNLKYCISGNGLEYRGHLDYAIGVPLAGIIKAKEYAKSQSIPLIGVLFETPNFNSKYHNELDSTERYWNSAKRAYAECYYIITISNLSKKYIGSWLNLEENKIVVIEPCINNKVADLCGDKQKKNQIVCLGRPVNFKGLNEIHELATLFPNISFKIVSSKKSIEKTINIEVLENISDKEKFELIKESKLLVHPSRFEGFGMTPGEALYCNTPALTYDLDVYKDFYGDSVRYAKDFSHLVYLIKKILREEYITPKNIKQKLSFESFIDRVKSNFNTLFTLPEIDTARKNFLPSLPKVSIGIICLNEEEYIESCVKNIYEWDCCHEIIIIEGSTELYRKANPGMVDGNGTSIDDTLDIIRKFPDTQRKIKILSGAWKDKFEMRSQYMSLATGDYIFAIDADEFYKKNDLEKLKQLLLANSGIEELKIAQKIFWHKFDKILGGSFDNLWLERFWKNKDIKLLNHHKVIHTSGRDLKLTDSGIYCYHYSNIRENINYVKAKINFYELRNKEVYGNKYKNHIEYNKSWLTWNDSVKKLPRGVVVLDYNIENHPNIIKQHPYYKKVNLAIPKKDNLKIGILYYARHSQAVSGGQYAVWRWIESLILNDVDVTFIGDGFPFYSNDEVKKPNFIEIDLVRGKYDSLEYPEIIFNELEYKVIPDFDVLIGVASSYIAPLALYAKKYTIPFVSIAFENPYSLLRYAGENFRPVIERPDWKNYFDGIIKSDLILCPSDSCLMWTKKWLKDFGSIPIETLYPPINDIIAKKVLLNGLTKKRQLITLGYWGGKKSTGEWLIKALDKLSEDLHLIVYSQYPNSSSWDKPLLDLNSGIEIKHRTTEVEKFTDLAESLICINPYATGGGDYQMKEAFSVGTLGLSFNVPVLIECVGGFGEIIPEGKLWEYQRQTKIQSDLEDYFIYKLADKLNWLLKNPDYAQFKINFGHKYIMENHTMSVIGKRFKQILLKYFK